MAQPGFGVDTVQLGRADQRVDRRCALAARVGPGKEIILAPESNRPQRALGHVVIDLDDAMATWRHKHVLTVERVIGGKPGTGGTAGASYLHSTLGKRAFPELWSLRTSL